MLVASSDFRNLASQLDVTTMLQFAVVPWTPFEGGGRIQFAQSAVSFLHKLIPFALSPVCVAIEAACLAGRRRVSSLENCAPRARTKTLYQQGQTSTNPWLQQRQATVSAHFTRLAQP